ncbi:MAG: DinB family protein, partial [Phenylobacterium sp.]
MSHSPYAQLIAVKRWADRGLCEAVGENYGRFSEQDATILLRIFDHIHAVDRIFQHHLLGRPHTYRAASSEALPAFDVLAGAIREVDDWYAGYVDGLSPGDFDQPVD